MSKTIKDVAKFAFEVAFFPIILGVKALKSRKKADTDSSTNITQPRPMRRFGIGVCRVSGARALRRSSGNYYHQVFIYPEGPCEFRASWMGEDQVRIISNQVQSLGGMRYETGRAKVYDRQGFEEQTAYSELVSGDSGWTTEHRGDGVPSNYLVCEHGKKEDASKQFPAGDQTEITREAAYFAYDWRKDDTSGGTGDQRRYANGATPAEMDAAMATWEVTGNPVVWFVNIEWRRFGAEWDKRFAPNLAQLTIAADVCDELVLQKNGSTQVSGTANKNSDNITLDSVVGIAVGTTITVSGMDLEVTSIAGNVVHITPDLSVDAPIFSVVRWTNATAAYAKRYEIGLWWESDTTRKQVREWLMGAMDGWFMPDPSGAYVIEPGYAEGVTVTTIFGEQEIIDFDFDPGPQLGEANNVYTLAFSDPLNGYKSVETDDYRLEDDITLSGRESSDDFAPDGVHNDSQVKRLAKARADREHAAMVSWRTPLSGRRGLGKRYVGLRISEEAALNDAIVEITEAPKFEMGEGPSILWTGKLANATRYAWNVATEEGDGPRGGYGSVPETLESPDITTIEVYFEDSGSGPAPRLRIFGTGPDRSDLGWNYRVRISGTTAWLELSATDSDPSPDVTLITGSVSAVSSLDVQIAYTTGGGSLSEWGPATPSTVNTSVASSTAYIAREAGGLLSREDGNYFERES